MNLMLGGLGLFGFFQLTFQWSTTLSPQGGVLSGEPGISWIPPFVHLPSLDWSNTSEMIAGATFYVSAGFSALLLGYLFWRIFRSFRP